jgi:hypothetical protein
MNGYTAQFVAPHTVGWPLVLACMLATAVLGAAIWGFFRMGR